MKLIPGVVVNALVKNEDKELANFIEFITELSRLELEIHSRGELTVSEITGVLRKFFVCFQFKKFYSEKSRVNKDIADSTYTRMATLLSLWASCEDLNITFEDVCELISFKELFAAVFYCSGFKGFQHLKNYLAIKGEDGKYFIPQEKLILYFIFIHLDELDDEYFSLAEKLPEQIFIVLMLGWLNCQMVISERGEKNRFKLYKRSEILRKITPNAEFVYSVINAWMFCSYSPSSNKMEIKKNINAMIRNFHKAKGFDKKEVSVKKSRKSGKPKLLIIHEKVGRNHAMFRCYIPFFSTLSVHFDVTSMSDNALKDNESRELFPNHIVINDTKDIAGIINTINDIAPDVIYYPSLGMAHFTVFLANLRLAPMQVMTPGHPESSFSEVMDFIYPGPVISGIESKVSEHVFQDVNYQFFSVIDTNFSTDLSETIKYTDGRKHIAINCSAMKISSDFISCLSQLDDQFEDLIQLHFYPSGKGFLNDTFSAKLKKKFPSAIVHPPMDYPDFLMSLGRCHFSLVPFPFGNTNSTVDAMLLNMPIVALKGYAICSYTDYLVLDTYHLSKHFVCDTLNDYIDMARKLISDEIFYTEAVSLMKSADVYAQINTQNESLPVFGDMLISLYNKLPMYKSPKHKVITWDTDSFI